MPFLAIIDFKHISIASSQKYSDIEIIKSSFDKKSKKQ
jgi:hypothetical protein